MKSHSEPTLADVAKEAGVSLTTVSRVLNNRGYLSQTTKDRVGDAIAKLGYRPSQLARALHGKKSDTIGLIVPTVALPFFGELAVEIENALAEQGYRILICNSMGHADRERDYLNLLVGNRVDGIISGAHNEALEEYQTIRMPLVTIDRELSPRIPNVRCNNETAGYDATRRLLDAGCHRPALLTSRAHPKNLREHGYRRALGEDGVEPVILEVPFHTDSAIRQLAVNECLNSVAEEIDGVFATDDLAAAEVLEWARLHNLTVPGDLRIIGFDGTQAIHRALPGLTTLRQPLDLIARKAVEILLAQINGETSSEAHGSADTSDDSHDRATGGSYEFPVTLIEGWTT